MPRERKAGSTVSGPSSRAGAPPQGPPQSGAHYLKYTLKAARADTLNATNGLLLETNADLLLASLQL